MAKNDYWRWRFPGATPKKKKERMEVKPIEKVTVIKVPEEITAMAKRIQEDNEEVDVCFVFMPSIGEWYFSIGQKNVTDYSKSGLKVVRMPGEDDVFVEFTDGTWTILSPGGYESYKRKLDAMRPEPYNEGHPDHNEGD